MIRSRKILETPEEILNLGIFDWNRLNGYWDGVGDALRTIESWLLPGFEVFDIEANDWNLSEIEVPGFFWEHVGNHVETGGKYWNWFYNTHPDGKLVFSDSPDFYGTLFNGEHRFWGDIGKVSPSAFMSVIHMFREGDLWITINGGSRQVVLEALYSPEEAWSKTLFPSVKKTGRSRFANRGN